MKSSAFALFLVASQGLSPSNAAVDDMPQSAVIRAGHSIAVTTCVACHVVDSEQTVEPVFGGGIPSFREIAERQDTTRASLTAVMSGCGATTGLARVHCWPTNRMSDGERQQVAAYILSLRSP